MSRSNCHGRTRRRRKTQGSFPLLPWLPPFHDLTCADEAEWETPSYRQCLTQKHSTSPSLLSSSPFTVLCRLRRLDSLHDFPSNPLLLASILSPVRDKPAISPKAFLVPEPSSPKVQGQAFFIKLESGRPLLLINSRGQRNVKGTISRVRVPKIACTLIGCP